MPTCSRVAAIIVGDLSDKNIHRDIIVEKRSGLLQRINELHPIHGHAISIVISVW